MSLNFKLLIFSLTMIVLLAAPAGRAQSQNSSITVDADQYTSRPNQVAELKGNVHIVQGLQSLTCDQAVINMATQEVTAKGSVRLISPEEFISAESLQYNFKTKKGLVKNGFVQMGQETIEGEEIIKDGDTQYLAKRASYTSCINCPPAWRLTGSEIDATAGSYAYIKNPIVRIYGAPIFWLPYIVIPIKTERQSGLLPPKYAFSGDNGFTFTPAYFWAINKSKDMTFYETYYKNRGFKTGVEYRYRTDKNSGGNFFGNYINDSRYGFEPKFLTPDRRYWNQGSYNLPFENRQV
ncbi:MAG: LPS-assembly protein LptD, partial [Oligoflexia bacterium]|nr:LPS-assembly protein LptD [Oligoflexia bacterium]